MRAARRVPSAPMADLPQPDERRDSAQIDALVELAHEHARRAHVAEVELAALRWQQLHEPDAVRLRAELAAVSAELDRLRALPELRVGQRVRHAASGLRRTAAAPPSEPAPERGGVARGGVDPAGRAAGGDVGTLDHPSLPAPCVVLVVRNRPSSLRLVVEWLEQHDVQPVEVVDNASSDPVLSTLLESLGAPVTRLPVDLGSSAVWASGALARRLRDGNVLVIDVDGRGVTLPAASCPTDVLDRMTHELARRPDLDAVELSPTSDQDPGRFRVIRGGLETGPAAIGRLDTPYVSVTIAPDADQPSERFADLHDQRTLDADR